MATNKYPRTRVSPIDPQYSWDHRILDIPFTPHPCPPRFALLLDEAWEDFQDQVLSQLPRRTAALPPTPSSVPQTAPPPFILSAKEIIAKVTREGQSPLASSSGLPATSSSALSIDTPFAEVTRNTAPASSLFDNDSDVIVPLAPPSSSSVLKGAAAPLREVVLEPLPSEAAPVSASVRVPAPTISAPPAATSSSTLVSKAVPASSPIVESPHEVVPETPLLPQERELVMPPPPALTEPSDAARPKSHPNGGFEGYYAPLLHCGYRLHKVFKHIGVRSFDPLRLISFGTDDLLEALSRQLFDLLVRYVLFSLFWYCVELVL